MKQSIKKIILAVAIIAILLIGSSFLDYNTKNQNTLVLQFGEVVKIVKEPGIFLRIPIIQKTKSIYIGEQLYDVKETEVITSDKKTMIANCYVTWQITDPKKYYQTLASETVAQNRIFVAVYNAMKNVIASTKQEDVISGKDGSLGDTILDKISMEQYGIAVTQNEMKLLDLPDDNKEAVHSRMISERKVIAAEYQANGERDSKNIKSATDATVRKTISEAQVIASETEATGESEYFSILAKAYGSSKSREDFYNFIIGLESMKKSLSEGGTVVIDKDSPLYNVLINQ